MLKSALMTFVNRVEELLTTPRPPPPHRIQSFQPMKIERQLSTTRLMNWPILRERIYWNSNAKTSIPKKSLECGLTAIYATTSRT